MRISVINTFVICHWCEKVKEGEMGNECNTHRRDGKCVHNFSWKARMELANLRDLDEDRLYLYVI